MTSFGSESRGLSIGGAGFADFGLFEQGMSDVTLLPSLAFLEDAGLGEGNHILEISKLGDTTRLLIAAEVTERPVPFEEDALEAIVTVGAKVRHYMIGKKTGLVAMVDSVHRIDENDKKTILDRETPPVFTPNSTVVAIRAGVDYRRKVLLRAASLSYSGSKQYETQLLGDLRTFSNQEPTHLKPTRFSWDLINS